MRGSNRLVLFLLVAPLTLSSVGFTCERRTGDTRLSSLEIEVDGVSIIGAFDPALRVYDVWLPEDAITATVRAQAVDPSARVTWYVPDGAGMLAGGTVGVGGGEVTIDLPPDGYSVYLGVFPPGGATDTYIVPINPACPVGQSCTNGGIAGNCVADTCISEGVARIEITPGAVVLTGVGETHLLTAQAYNAVGQALDASFTWTSTHPNHAAVGPDGTVTAASALGSSSVVATAEGVDSPPAIVTIATPAPGAVFVSDQQVASPPRLEDPTVELGLGSRIELSLQGVPAPDVGDILLPRESLSVGGRVVDVQDAGGGVLDVVIEMIPLSEMYDSFAISETIPLPTDQAVISDTAAQYYDMERQPDGSFLFTLKANPVSAKAAVGTRAIGPFDCDESNWPQGSVTLDTFPPTISVDPRVDLIVEWDTDDLQDDRIVVVGELRANLSAKIKLNVAIQADLSCKFTAFEIPFPVLGVPLFYAGATVPIGAGFSLGGALSAPAEFDISVSPRASVTGGMRCPVGQDCNFFFDGDLDVTQTVLTPVIDIGNPALPIRVEPKIEGFVFSELDIGVDFVIAEFKINVVEIKGGFVQAGSFATMDAQLDDPNYRSNYTLGVELSASAGDTIKKFLDFVEVKLTVAEAKLTEQYAQSPTMLSASADVGSYNLGDTVNFTVELDSNSTDYSLFGYNVDEILIFERELVGGGFSHEQVASAAVSASGQTSFTVSWDPPFSGSVEDRFFAAVSTKLLPDMPFGFGNLELGMIAPGVDEDCTTEADEDGDGFGMCDDMDSCSDHPSCTGTEICANGIDDDGDLATDCDDTDCQDAFGRCEICDDNGFSDEDGDLLVNCEDPDCGSHWSCEICDDGIDNNTSDTWSDCESYQCRGIHPSCGVVCSDPGSCSDPICAGVPGCDTYQGHCNHAEAPAQIGTSPVNSTQNARIEQGEWGIWSCMNGYRYEDDMTLISTSAECDPATGSVVTDFSLPFEFDYQFDMLLATVTEVTTLLENVTDNTDVIDSNSKTLSDGGVLQAGEYQLRVSFEETGCEGAAGRVVFVFTMVPVGYIGEHCLNGADDDNDGEVDCEDSDCQAGPHIYCQDFCNDSVTDPTPPRADGSEIIGKTFRDETAGYCEYYTNGGYVGWDRSFGSYSGTWTYNGTVTTFDADPDFQYTVAIACDRGLWYDYPENTPFANEGVFEDGDTCQPF